jgi:4-amino-4-deoxy-L-arabinose transferase-like glycosyltransferase
MRKIITLPVLLIIVSLSLWLLSVKLLFPPYLTFSDSAKFADIARNLANGSGLGSNFAPFDTRFLNIEGLLPISAPPLLPILIAMGFKIFSIHDFVVVLLSGILYIASALILYFIGKKYFNQLVGFLASLAFIFDFNLLNYASIGASESLFIFEILLTILLFSQKKKLLNLLGFLILIALYLTRQSAILYIFGLSFFYTLLNFQKIKDIIRATCIFIFGYIVYEIFANKYANGLIIYSPLFSFFNSAVNFSPSIASTTSLRGGEVNSVLSIKPLASKIFYNLYNYYKLLPDILSPYLGGLFLFSFFRTENNREQKIFRFISLLLIIVTFLSAAAVLPLFRYIHPIIPFVYLLGIEMLVWILQKISTDEKKVWVSALLLVGFFIMGQTLGKVFLDSRFIRSHTNRDMPPVYVGLSRILKEKTKPDNLIITNLDTWGTWYGERKTIWFPIEPEQLKSGLANIDAIYLTSYKIDDENYFMGNSWRQAFLNPENIQDSFLRNNFKVAGTFEIKPGETYEREGATAILYIKK